MLIRIILSDGQALAKNETSSAAPVVTDVSTQQPSSNGTARTQRKHQKTHQHHHHSHHSKHHNQHKSRQEHHESRKSKAQNNKQKAGNKNKVRIL